MIGVNVSSFSFKYRNKKKDYIPFDSNFSCLKKDCPFSCNNVLELIREFYNARLSPEKIDYYQKYFATKENSFKIEENDNRIFIFFDVLYGAYGINSDITNVDTNEVEFNRKLNNADVKNFRVMFAFSKRKPGYDIVKGVVLFQVTGHYGVKTMVYSKFKDFLSKNFNVTPIFYTISSREAIKNLIKKCNFKKVTLIKNEPQPEFASIWGINCGKETRTYLLRNIKEKQKFGDVLINLLTSDKQVCEIIDGYDDISFTVDNNGRSKTIRVDNLDNISLVENLPEEVLDVDGKIITSKIDNYMMNIANDYLKDMVEGVEVLV